MKEYLKLLLNVNEIFQIQARIIVVGAAFNDGETTTEQSLKGEGIYKLKLGGSGFTKSAILAPKDWEMLDCEIFIVPKSISRNKKWGDKPYDGRKMSQVLTGGFADPANWDVTETF